MVTFKQKIVPHLWYDKDARAAAEFYCTIFPDSKIANVTTICDTPSGDCEIVSFSLSGQPFMSISAGPLFKFNEAISFMIYCDSQDEIDYYWNKLSAVPASEQCGWLKDKYGLSWQIVCAEIDTMLQSEDAEKLARFTQAMLPMKKLDIAALRNAFEGK